MVIDTYVDARGHDLMGEDEHGVWFGTELAPVTLEDRDPEDGYRLRTRKRRYTVTGFLESQPFVAYVRASSLRRAWEYFEAWRVRDLSVTGG